MQLKKIKLAGFKSFVDPTVVMLPSQLVAIVGPNGCGKSNIIDAVCWVMGESSAKYLRGESLTDVIFNGSTARKPIGQASVELVFDNQDGSLGGEYASYAEISIRRQIGREADSAYFLNGVRCRRRDIIDIFLGTGLGPRSYSIIGQNMISRIIEAKPDDMRHYLEEAAGVSKYKERRRETENRIAHTKDNLLRLNDVRVELDKQLATLKRQANAAEKFQVLKQEERLIRAQWLAIQWRDLDMFLVRETLQIQQQSTALEAKSADMTDLNLQLEYKREEQGKQQEMLQEVQRRYYAAGSDITRLEQDIHHQEERQKQWQIDVNQVTQDSLQVNEEMEELNAQLEELLADIETLEPEVEEVRQSTREKQLQLKDAERTMQEWQNQWDMFNASHAKNTQIAEVEQTRIQHLDQKITSVKDRQAHLTKEQAQLNFSTLEEQIQNTAEKAKLADAEIGDHGRKLSEIALQIQSTRTLQQQSNIKLDEVRNQLQVIRGKEASLQALQETALGRKNNPLNAWLLSHRLDQKPKLAEGVQVESGWEHAVEKVLSAYLQAVCVDDLKEMASLIGDLKKGSLCVVSKSSNAMTIDVDKHSLISKVKSAWPLESILSHVYIAESLDEAYAKSSSLKSHESVITRDGVWLGATWMRVVHDESPEAGIFERDNELKQLEKRKQELSESQHALEQELSRCSEQLKSFEALREELQKAENQSHAKAATIHAEHRMTEQRLAEMRKRSEQYAKELTESAVVIEKSEAEVIKARSTWSDAMASLEQFSIKRDALVKDRDLLRDRLQRARSDADLSKDNAHQIEIRLQTSKSQQASVKQTLQRLVTQSNTLNERKAALQKDISSADTLEIAKADLTKALSARLTVESDLNAVREQLEVINQSLKSVELQRVEIERDIAKLRDGLEGLRVECQGVKVKAETVRDQLQETGLTLEDTLKDLQEGANEEEWRQQLDQIMNRITRLGAINLVAIEEYATCAERKEYLDAQNADLQEGLQTLENAIAKIDKETRALFRETFDKVNDRFRELFPTVFGGGEAYLELTGENLLDAGIVVMACPPGKRNSTIHLLSGGEKALTAIALVFSIFHLNPAPFCLLDEVDAPLDDANIGRFCNLVKKMSEKTQFIFISHNKLAIEMGENLIGVTMHEPGVSRLVSVDVHEAISLAEA